MSDLPDEVIDEAVRLTRLARRATDEAEAGAYRAERTRVLEPHGFVARTRKEERGTVLVLYPADWIEDGMVQPDRIHDLDRAVERRLAGADGDEWEAVEAHNRELVAAVEEEAGPVHAANAAAFADFMGNHYVKPMESATRSEVCEFLEEYFPRNAWPTAQQRDVVEESVRLVFRAAGTEPPGSI